MARKLDQIRALLESIETGDPGPVQVVNQARYIQHNPQTHEGSEGLEQLFKRLSLTNPKVNMVRGFEDGDYVFAQMEYDFSSPKICFEVFRFEDGQAVEHWDNMQPRLGPNLSGHTMVDGSTTLCDLDLTEPNRATIKAFVKTVLVERNTELLGNFLNTDRYQEHNPHLSDTPAELTAALSDGTRYQKLHRVLAQGNFVLSVSEGTKNGTHTAFYDLFRLHDNKIVEHWDTTEPVAPQSDWKNTNGKF